MELFVPDVHVCFIFLTVSAGFLHNCSLGRSKCEQIKPNKTIKTMYIYLQMNTHIPRAQQKTIVNVQKRKLKKYCNYPELLDLWHPACNQCHVKTRFPEICDWHSLQVCSAGSAELSLVSRVICNSDSHKDYQVHTQLTKSSDYCSLHHLQQML